MTASGRTCPPLITPPELAALTKRDMRVAGHEIVGDGGAAALVRQVEQLDARPFGEGLGVVVIVAADADAGIADLAGVGLGEGDELRIGLGCEILGGGGEHQRDLAQPRHHQHVLVVVDLQLLLVDDRREHVGARDCRPAACSRRAATAPFPRSAMMPKAPGLFSITTGWPRIGRIWSPTMRMTMSVALPGPNGTTTLIGFVGNLSCAVRRCRRQRRATSTTRECPDASWILSGHRTSRSMSSPATPGSMSFSVSSRRRAARMSGRRQLAR